MNKRKGEGGEMGRGEGGDETYIFNERVSSNRVRFVDILLKLLATVYTKMFGGVF